jgi:hypothetical protein
MDDTLRKAKLNDSLRKAMALVTLSTSQEYREHLLPYLKELAHTQPISPHEFKKEEEYLFALKQNNMRAAVYGELISFLASQEIIMGKIRQELEKTPKSHGI